KKAPQSRALRLRAPRRDEDGLRCRAGIQQGDPLAQEWRPVGLGVLEGLFEQSFAREVFVEQFLDAQWLNAALGQIPADGILVQALCPFHLETRHAHDGLRVAKAYQPTSMTTLPVVRRLASARWASGSCSNRKRA